MFGFFFSYTTTFFWNFVISLYFGLLFICILKVKYETNDGDHLER